MRPLSRLLFPQWQDVDVKLIDCGYFRAPYIKRIGGLCQQIFTTSTHLKTPGHHRQEPFTLERAPAVEPTTTWSDRIEVENILAFKRLLPSAHKPLVDILVDNLSETEALHIEAELISAFGTEETGGLLTNSVVPTGLSSRRRSDIVVPQGTVEQAQLALAMLKDAVEKLIAANPNGITNSDAASLLGLRSDYLGRQKDYLSYSVLGLLLREGRVTRREGRSPRHVSSTQA